MSGLMTPLAGSQTKRTCYFYDKDIGNFHYAPFHPMKPHRIRMTHALVMAYGLSKKMEIFRAKPASKNEMTQFHADEYIEFLARVTPELVQAATDGTGGPKAQGLPRDMGLFNVGDDCPVFDGLFEYCAISAGGSMEGAARLSRDKCDVAVNWAGGLHHAKRAEASGFCYVNDIVLGILEILRYKERVLYIDIDVHHGDGVEEAFCTTDRVMTCSFHKYGDFFPGTGDINDIGYGKGKYHAINVPLRDGIDDFTYERVFKTIVGEIVRCYQPSAIVLQCGADSLSGDRLGSFNLSAKGHGMCVDYVKSFNLPLLLLGGGGYTIRNVPRAWAYETGLAVGQELVPKIPLNEYYEYFGPMYELDVLPSNAINANTPEYLQKVVSQLVARIRRIGTPSVQQQPIPKTPFDLDSDSEVEDEDLDDRRPANILERRVQRNDEFSDSEDEGEGGRRNIQSFKDDTMDFD